MSANNRKLKSRYKPQMTPVQKKVMRIRRMRRNSLLLEQELKNLISEEDRLTVIVRGKNSSSQFSRREIEEARRLLGATSYKVGELDENLNRRFAMYEQEKKELNRLLVE